MNKRDEAILNLADPDDEIFQLRASARTKWWLEALDFLNLGIHDMILDRKVVSRRWHLVGSGKRWKLCALNQKDEPTRTDTPGLRPTQRTEGISAGRGRLPPATPHPPTWDHTSSMTGHSLRSGRSASLNIVQNVAEERPWT